MTYSRVMESPIGFLTLTASETGLRAVNISDKLPADPKSASSHKIVDEAVKQLQLYFRQKLEIFDLPLDFDAAPAFSKSVWNLLLQIPYGKTKSYGEIARGLGDINKSRAVGLANGSNPLAIVVPCHRVIGGNGALTGYGGGLAAKEYLLMLENPARLVRQGLLF
ncbi:MAG: methylated-DNA--[protein]-cysteine S-methyltransferase [Saprospiraceae bacterium]|nr:methylated-DNA--[protein]-cysteine S-methyltransferase [Saprospiraceae bacterium]